MSAAKQGLPEKTPNCVTLSLLGFPPVELIMPENILNLFVSSARSKESVEYDILKGQHCFPRETHLCSIIVTVVTN